MAHLGDTTDNSTAGPGQRIQAPVLVEWQLLTGDRIARLRDLARRRSLILVLPTDEPTNVLALLGTGVRALIAENSGPSAIALASAAIAAGGCHISAELAGKLDAAGGLGPAQPPGAPMLATRELEVLRYLTRGFTHRQVARRMGVSEATVHTHAKRLRRKLNATNKADLTRRAMELGYAEDIPRRTARGPDPKL